MQFEIDLGNKEKLSRETFLTYMGSKTKVREDLFRALPADLPDRIVSPFIGGGGFELFAASNKIRVLGYDISEHIVRTWNTMLRYPKDVAAHNYRHYPHPKKYLEDIVRDKTYIEDDIEHAAAIWAGTKQAYSGMILNGGYFGKPKVDVGYFDPDTWSFWGNDYLSVDCLKWEDTLEKHSGEFLFCDPPYVGLERYYHRPPRPKKMFDHEKLAEHLAKWDNGWILTYVEHPSILELYKDFEIIRHNWNQGSVARHRDADSTQEIIIVKPPARNPYDVSNLTKFLK